MLLAVYFGSKIMIVPCSYLPLSCLQHGGLRRAVRVDGGRVGVVPASRRPRSTPGLAGGGAPSCQGAPRKRHRQWTGTGFFSL